MEEKIEKVEKIAEVLNGLIWSLDARPLTGEQLRILKHVLKVYL
ncbi:hypothetical protein [uncultured Mediterranean phage uvMED]|nr:hypothetical protein [uncultured Mediterranean phage uvMED]